MARHSPFHSLFARRPSGLRKRKEGIVLGWSGNDLLSRVLRHSTIGAEAFNGRVRDGIGFRRLAQITGPAKDILYGLRRRRAFALAGLRPVTLARSEVGKQNGLSKTVVHGHGP